jgi:hypothetical protein
LETCTRTWASTIRQRFAGAEPAYREALEIQRRLLGNDHPATVDPGLGQAEVEHLDLAVGRHLHLRGLQVAVDDALLVGSLERLGDLLR